VDQNISRYHLRSGAKGELAYVSVILVGCINVSVPNDDAKVPAG
jgi:hypothetical protein